MSNYVARMFEPWHWLGAMSASTSFALALVLSIPLCVSGAVPAPVDVCGVEVSRCSIMRYMVAGEILSADEAAARIPLANLVSALVAPMRRPLIDSLSVVSDPLAGGFERVSVDCCVLGEAVEREEHLVLAHRIAAGLRAAGLIAAVDGLKVVVMAA